MPFSELTYLDTEGLRAKGGKTTLKSDYRYNTHTALDNDYPADSFLDRSHSNLLKPAFPGQEQRHQFTNECTSLVSHIASAF